MSGHAGPGPSPSGGLPVAPSLGPTLEGVRTPRTPPLVDRRVAFVSAISIGLAAAACAVAQTLSALIALITNAAFYGRLSLRTVSPAHTRLGLAVILVPVLGGLVVGLMARFGSRAIRGHGIPEAMEQVLFNQSRIPPRLTFLKPLSAAVAIGTGGPFGAEGPIIATGGALGSLIGQLLHISADERKTLLAAGAAAGMTATFGTPVSAVLLAVELLLFEYRARSVVPVALASAAAAALRIAMVGPGPVFATRDFGVPGGAAITFYVLLGMAMGGVSVLVTRAVYAIEDAFDRLPLHWMWWPALGGLAVGLIGVVAPRTLGVGYDNIEAVLNGSLPLLALAMLAGAKFVSWSLALGSGTSGGTLAPLFTIGGALGATAGAVATMLAPSLGVDPRLAGLVGMAALFAGASRALLASVVFAFETTRQPLGLLPLLGGCTAAYFVSALLMRHSIMTEKIARRGARVLNEYVADHLSQQLVADHAAQPVVTLQAGARLGDVQRWLLARGPGSLHQGFPVVEEHGALVGVLTRRDLLDHAADPEKRLRELVRRPPVAVFPDCSLREAADLMVQEKVGRVVVLSRVPPHAVEGILTRSDLLGAHEQRLEAASVAEPVIDWRDLARARSAAD